MTSNDTHGGRREGAGRPKGSLNKKSLEAIQEVAEQWPNWSPLKHLATVANDETLDVETRLDAAKAAAPYCHAKLKPVTADADELVDLEHRLHAARLHAAADALAERPGLMGLADRLSRLRERDDTALDALATYAAVASKVIEAQPQPASPPQKPAASAVVDEAPPDPRPEPTGDWARPAADYRPILPAWPDQPASVDVDYDTLPDTLLSAYKD